MRPQGQQLKELTNRLAKAVLSMGVVLQPGVSEECAAAVALILFASTGVSLPGGFAGEELSANSPINKVQEFSQEFVMLGRATVMIKGIANRLGVPWGLSDRWALAAKESLDANPSAQGPVWTVSQPSVFSPQHSMSSLLQRQRKGEGVGLKEIIFQLGMWIQLVQVLFISLSCTYEVFHSIVFY